jgi:nicotinate-nucleotide pyrophosphorylase (carboxylating)
LIKNFNGNDLLSHEGKNFKPGFVIEFSAPFSVALQVERTALNLLRRASAIATTTNMLSSKAKKIKILDTRKTTPGLRWLEKYAVRVGGGFNHRLGQVDSFMIKDNHKSFFGGLKPAFDFFQSQGSFYQGIIAEIHNLQEFEEAVKLGIRHVMLDNFQIEDIKKAVKLKSDFMTIELSGGINLDNIENYLIDGVDAISSGSITEWPKPVDISLKMKT